MDGSGARRSPGLWPLLMTLWFGNAAWADMIAEADRSFPLETGGILMGYWNEDQVVVTLALGPGPDAQHFGTRFKPDHAYQQHEIDKIYRSSNGAETYLGDWHTHPNANEGVPSWTDKATARRIAKTAQARAPRPVTLILFGEPQDWGVRAWTARLVSLREAWSRVKLDPLTLRRY